MAWALFTLDSLIDNWGKFYQSSKTANGGDFDDAGVYQKPEDSWGNDFGVLAPMTNELFGPIDFGVYTTQDMYCITRSNYQIGHYVKDGTKIYKVHEEMDVSNFDETDLRVYKVKKQGRLDKS